MARISAEHCLERASPHSGHFWAPAPIWGSGRPARRQARGSPRLTNAQVATLLGLLGAGVALRLYALDGGLWLDEVLTLVNYARVPLGAIVTSYPDQNQHVLYSVLARLSFILFGESGWALRLPAALFGVASLIALFSFARRVTDSREALVATALLTLSYHHIWFSQNARGYSGLLFWTLVSSTLFYAAMTQRRSGLWPFYGLAVALGMYTHLTMLFLVIGHALVFGSYVLRRPAPRTLRHVGPAIAGFALSGLLTIQLYAFMLPELLGPGLEESTAVEQWNSLWWTIRELVGGLALNRAGGLAAVVASMVFGVGLVSYWRTQPIVPLLLIIPAVFGAAITLGMGHPLWPRFFLFLAGFGVLVVVRGTRVTAERLGALAGAGWHRQNQIGVAACMLLVLISSVTTPLAYRPKQDFVAAQQFVESSRQPGEAVIAVGLATFPYTEYLAPSWLTATSAEDIRAIHRTAKGTWVLSTLRAQLQTSYPDIDRLIHDEFDLVAEFHGSVSDGEILVFHLRGS